MPVWNDPPEFRGYGRLPTGPVDTDLLGQPGGINLFGCFEAVHLDGAAEILLDGNGSVLTVGVKGFIRAPYTGTIVLGFLASPQTGTLAVDVLKGTTQAGATSITASAPLTLTAAAEYSDATLTGWDVDVTAGDWIGFQVLASPTPATITRATAGVTIRRS